MRDEQRDPGQETEDGGEVDKVAKDNRGCRCGVHESSAAEERRDGQSWYGATALVSPLEDLWGVTLLSKTIDGTRGNVQI